jgi:hypothetical protein
MRNTTELVSFKEHGSETGENIQLLTTFLVHLPNPETSCSRQVSGGLKKWIRVRLQIVVGVHDRFTV